VCGTWPIRRLARSCGTQAPLNRAPQFLTFFLTSDLDPRTLLLDTHCHLTDARFADDLAAVLDRARAAGVSAIVVPATDLASIEQALGLAARHPEVFVMAGIHPTYVQDHAEADLYTVEQYVHDPRVVAVGETGLDHHWSRDHDALQEHYLRAHIAMAAASGKPLSLHTRAADDAVVAVLRDERARLGAPERLTGVFHCFGGTTETAQAVLELGFYAGLGGTLTFKNSTVPGATAALPLERLVLETDAPYLAPMPHRGRRNEPAYVRLVAERLAEVRGLPFEEVAATTTATARRLFGIRET
jgi:TatD DNase family protein